MSKEDQLHAMRHTAAHVLAAAAQRLHPEAKFGVGPVVEAGFYYDILFPEPITEDDLKALEKAMKAIIKEKHEMVREELSIEEGIEKFKGMKQDFKVELLETLQSKGTTKINLEEAQDVDPDATTASIYKTGEFVDLCRGPHLENVKEIGAFKLWKLAGAYWRGDDKNPQMQRVYGLCFATKDELNAHITMLEEAKKRDHRKLGKALDLFTFSDLVGSGLPLFTPRGTVMREQLAEFVWRLMKPYGYSRVRIPHMAKSDLYKTSGHWDKFADDIFHISSQKTEQAFVMKPMNCPHHTQIYTSQMRSYRDLPIRLSEVTAVYRDENTGQLQGLSRVRSITQDDAHVFCRMDQVKEESLAIYEIIKKFYAAFNMDLRISLSVNDPEEPEKYLGGAKVWKDAVGTLEGLLKEIGKEYEVAVGDAAFYGPKIDFIATDAIGREWQLATIQLDFNLPERFELEYVDESGEKVRPVMIHRAISGSLERFMAVMIEHYAGAFPMWLAPEQVRVVTVSDVHAEFAGDFVRSLEEADVRAELDASNEKIGKKIRNAAMMKVPWTIVIGDKELEGGDLQVKVFGQEEGVTVPQSKFLERIQKESAMPLS